MPIAEPLRYSQYIRGHEDFNYPGTWRILDILPDTPDIVHCHNLHGGYFDLRYLPWLGKKFPLILNLRDAWLLTGHCAYFLDCERWQSDCGNCPYLNIYPSLWRDGTAYNWQRKRRILGQTRFYVTAPSQWLIDQAQRANLNALEYRMIPNGIDLSIFRKVDKIGARRKLGLPEDKRIILFAANRARSNPYKDYRTVEQAMRLLGERKGIENILFVCVGSTGKSWSIGHVNVAYHGYVTDPNTMADYYCAADIFIHAAKAEAFGKTIVEAQACGTPVVATAVGGITELIDSDRSGILVPISDSVAMANQIIRVLNDENLQQKLAQEGNKSAQQYSIQRQADVFLNWYSELIEKHKRSAGL